MAAVAPQDGENRHVQQRRASTSQRRVSGVDLAAHHYVPFIPKRKASTGSACRITASNAPFVDYKHIYPYIDVNGTTVLLTEYDFHKRMARKYKGLLGDVYLYPVFGTDIKVSKDELCELTRSDEKFLQVLLLPEVEMMVPGGIDTIRTNKKRLGLFIIGKKGDIFPGALKTILNKEMKELEMKLEGMQMTSNFAVPEVRESMTSDRVIQQFIQGLEIPNVKRIWDFLGFTETEEEMRQKIEKMESVGILYTPLPEFDMAAYYDQVRYRKNRFVDMADWREFKDDEPFDWDQWETTNCSPDPDSGASSRKASEDQVTPNTVLLCELPNNEGALDVSGRASSQTDEDMPALVNSRATEGDDDVFRGN